MPIYGTTPDATSGTKGKIQLAGSLAGTAGTPLVAAGAITNAMLDTAAGGIGAALADWNPTYANLTIGNGTVTAKYVQLGKLVFLKFTFVLGSTSAVGTGPTVSLPVTAITLTGTASAKGIGWATFYDTSGADTYTGPLVMPSTTTMAPRTQIITATNTRVGTYSATNPIAFGTGDEMHFQGFYEAA